MFSFVRRSWRVLSGGPATASGLNGNMCRFWGELWFCAFVLAWGGFVYGFRLCLCVFRFCVSSSETWPLSILSLAWLVNLLSLPDSNLKLHFFAPLWVGWMKWARWPYFSPVCLKKKWKNHMFPTDFPHYYQFGFCSAAKSKTLCICLHRLLGKQNCGDFQLTTTEW